jgi:hypothetical protein
MAIKHLSYLLFPSLVSTVVMADDINSPYKTSNRNPFVQIYGLPVAQDAILTPKGKINFSYQYEVASNFTTDAVLTDLSSEQMVVIDGETHRHNMEWSYGYSNRLAFSFSIPYMKHKGGSLDSFINDWHDTFNLPDGGRESFADYQLNYYYQNSDEGVSIVQPQHGVGDVSLSTEYLWAKSNDLQYSLHSGIKLPTGDADKLLGSGSTDVYTSFNVSTINRDRWNWHSNVGLLWMSDGDVLSGIREDWVAFGSATLSWSYNQRISLKTQLDMHSAFYDSNTTELGSSSVQWILGAAVAVTENWLLDLSISEDVAVDTAPDVVFQLGINRVYF